MCAHILCQFKMALPLAIVSPINTIEVMKIADYSAREMSLCRRHRTLRFHGLNNRIRELRGPGAAAYVPREFGAVTVNLVDGVANLQRGVVLSEMAEHQQGRAQDGRGIRDILAGDIGGRAVDGFEDSALVPEICPGDQAQ